MEIKKTGLEIKNLSFSYVEEIILENINLSIKKSEFIAIVGPSGCGKSTLLNLMGGIIQPDSGNIFLNHKKVTKPQKELGMVFQDYSLFPWLTVKGNVEFGLKLQKISLECREKKVFDILKKVELLDVKNKYPHELSGGMRQRVAIARSIANDSEYILMDEPFGALDHQTRESMQKLLLQISKDFKKTIIFITHHIEDAVYLSDKIIIMKHKSQPIIIENNLSKPRNVLDSDFLLKRKEILDLWG